MTDKMTDGANVGKDIMISLGVPSIAISFVLIGKPGIISYNISLKL